MLELIKETNADALSEYRKLAGEKLQAVGMPTGRKEPYKYVPVSRLYDQTFTLGTGQSFVEAVEDIVVLPLDLAMRSYKSILEQSLACEESDPFALLSRALMGSSLFVYVPPKMQIEKVIEIVQGVEEEQVMAPYVYIAMGREASASFKFVTKGKQGSCHLPHIDCLVEENAHLKLLHQRGGCWEFETLRANVKRDGQLFSYHMLDASESVRSDLRVTLSGEGAQATLKGLSDLAGQRQAHQNILIEHAEENTHSNQHFKTVLRDEARASFEGKIYVHSKAQLTRAYQLNNNLMLGDKVVANSKPNLEIFADDVKASHGCTMAQLDADELFYIKSRGIDERSAKEMLKTGFCREIIDEVVDAFGSF